MAIVARKPMCCVGHTSNRELRPHQTTPYQCGLLCDGGAFAARFSGSKEAVGHKRRVGKVPVPFYLVTATTPQSSESGLWLSSVWRKKPQKLVAMVVVHHNQNEQTSVKPIADVGP